MTQKKKSTKVRPRPIYPDAQLKRMIRDIVRQEVRAANTDLFLDFRSFALRELKQMRRNGPSVLGAMAVGMSAGVKTASGWPPIGSGAIDKT